MSVRNTPLIVDASVWVAAFDASDAFHEPARRFLRHCQRHGIALASPTLAMVEVGCALSRRLRSPARGLEAATRLAALPFMRLAPSNAGLEGAVLVLGTELGLRGADALYAALAVHLAAALVTTDRELLLRTAERLKAWTPAGWLEAHAAGS